MNNKILYSLMLGLGALAVTSCSDPMDEIKSVSYARVFSPLDFNYGSETATTVNLRWVASAGASSYTIEVFADDSLTFSGEPVQTLTNLSADDSPYKVENLIYDTRYSARIMAIDSANTSRNSKWSTVTFTTSAQQIFDSIPNANIADKSVVLTWPAGEAVTRITANYTDETTKTTTTVVDKTLTAEEIAAGKATVDGLTASTKYTIYLYNGTKRRGTRTVTTIADLAGATVVREGDNLKTIIAEAAEGTTIALMPGTFVIQAEEGVEGAGSAVVSKSIVIRGIYPTETPTIQGNIQINDGASLEIDNVVFDGSLNEACQTFDFKTEDQAYGKLVVTNSEIKNYVKGVFYLNVASTVGEMTFRNCLIHDIVCDGGDLFDNRKGRIDAFTLANSTIWNCATERDVFRMDDSSGTFAGSPTITVQNCTFNNLITASTTRRFLYVRYVGTTINWSNNIVSNTTGIWSNQSKTSVPTFQNNVYYGAANLNTVVEKANLFADESGNVLDPGYKDAANGDFTITNDEVKSLGVGDPRWITTQ